MNYYKQEQIIATCDKDGNVTGEIEKWEAHRKGILHRALTVALIFEGKYILQHRKHPAFDGVLDLTSSSHPLIENGKLQDTTECAVITLMREWDLQREEIGEIKNEGAVYYKAKDENSEFIEHEYCEILVTEVKRIPNPNLDYAYGASLADKSELMDKNSQIYSRLAPWAKKMIDEKLI